MPVTELSLLYCYRFGFSISDALKFVCFKGKVKDFIEQQPCFSMHHGCVCLHPTIDMADARPASELHLPGGWGMHSASDFCEVSVQRRCVECGGDDETTSTADSENSVDTNSCYIDASSTVDTDHGDEADEDAGYTPNPNAWRNVGCRIAAAFEHSSEDECCQDSPNLSAWRSVGCRVSAALKHSIEAASCQDHPDPAAWVNVGGRLAAAFKQNSDGEDCDEDTTYPAAWGNAGDRLIAALKQSSEGDDCDNSFKEA